MKQGYSFHGHKERELKRRLEACKRDPDYARALFGLRPRGRVG